MAHRISTGFNLQKLMLKETYDPNDDGKISLGIIDIDQNLNMGSHDIVLDAGRTVDAVDVSEHTHHFTKFNLDADPIKYEYSHVNSEKTVLELEHLFVGNYSAFEYEGYVYCYDTGGGTFNFPRLRLYVDGEQKAEDIFENIDTSGVGETKRVYKTFDNIGTGHKKVEVKIWVDPDSDNDLKGLKLKVISYEMSKP